MWFDFIANKLSVVVNVSGHGAVKLWRGACARCLVFVGNTVNWLRESVFIDRWRALARSIGGIVAEHRVITWIRRAPDLRRFFHSLALCSAEAFFLCVC